MESDEDGGFVPDPDSVPDAVHDVLRMMKQDAMQVSEKKSRPVFACYSIPTDCSIGMINGRLHLVKHIDLNASDFAPPSMQLTAMLNDKPEILLGPNLMPSVPENANFNELVPTSDQLSDCVQISW